MALRDLCRVTVVPWKSPQAVDVSRFRFEVTGHTCSRFIGIDGEGLRVEVHAEVRDRESGRPLLINFSKNFFPACDEHTAIRETLIESLTHEVDECLLVNGERIHDPHVPRLEAITAEVRSA
jgi:hypothetical protein